LPREFIKLPLLYHAPLLQYIDAVGVPDRTETMGNDYARYPQPGQARGDDGLRAVVQGAA
jgi:hypothetical protein